MATKSKKEIAKAIRLTWESLESHLDSSTRPLERKLRKHIKTVGGQRFHAKCVKEYATIINTLANQL